MTGTADLTKLLASINPTLSDAEMVFCVPTRDADRALLTLRTLQAEAAATRGGA